jgi:hypothetical protein
MTLLPIVERELRVAARRRSTYWLRFVSVLTAGTICFWMLESRAVMWTTPGTGPELFRSICWTAFWFCLSAGLFTTADSISVERREGTLRLLFLTDLKGHEVVLGKLAATSLNAAYALVAILPVLAIPMFLGGVTLFDLARAGCALFATLLLSLSTGLFVSSLSRSEVEGVLGTLFMVLLGVFGLLPLMLLVVVWLTGGPLGMAGFGGWLEMVLLGGGLSSWATLSMLVVVVVSMALIAAASYFTRHQPDDASWLEGVLIRLRLKFQWKPRALWSAETGWLNPQLAKREIDRRLIAEGRRRIMLRDHPIVWLVLRQRVSTIYLWIVLGMLVGLYLAGLVILGMSWLEWNVALLVTFIGHVVFKVLLAFEVPRQLVQDRRSGALELLLSTSLTIEDIVDGHLLAIERQFKGPVMVILVFDAYIIFLSGAFISGDPTAWASIAVGQTLFFVLDTLAIRRFGLLVALRSRSVNSAAISCMLQVMALPWVIALTVAVLGIPALAIFAFVVSSLALDFAGMVSTEELKVKFREWAGTVEGRSS